MSESKKLVREFDELIKEVRNMEITSSVMRTNRDFTGEVIKYDDEVVVNQEIPVDADPKVKYGGGKFIIEFNGIVKEYEVGCIDKSTIKAERRFTTLVIRAKRCDSEADREDKGSTQEE